VAFSDAVRIIFGVMIVPKPPQPSLILRARGLKIKGEHRENLFVVHFLTICLNTNSQFFNNLSKY
jgi:hypothetical protein